jgi:hypothetical protein
MRGRRGGQATIEFALLYGGVIIPLTFGMIYVSEMYWIWHSMVEFTRDGARYAATHCFQSDAQNVVTYMQTHVPVNIDQVQFQTGGTAEIDVVYQQLDPSGTGQLGPMQCDGTCSTDCVPDAVTVSISNYQITWFVTYLNLPPVVLPPFPTSVSMQSNGCNGDNGSVVCNP